MSYYLFEVIDKSRRKIILTRERWQHITQEHPHINNPELIKENLVHPLKITGSKYDSYHVCYYYRYLKTTKKYLFVAVKYLNGEGFVITAYYMRKIE